MNKLKIIKIIVCLLTFLLVFGSLTAAGIIYKKINRTQPALRSGINLEQQNGSSIADYKIENGTLYVLVKDGGESDRIIIINPSDTKPAAVIKLN